MRLSTITIMLAASFALASSVQSAPISMAPYPFTVTVGLVCRTADALKSALDTFPAPADANPDCAMLSGQTATQATATPVEIYSKNGMYGMITKYSAPGLDDIFGLMQLEPAPAHKPSDVNA